MINNRGNADGLFQQTLKKPVTITGIGLHSGAIVTLTIAPADANSGITFIRTDLRGAAAIVPARWDAVVDTRMCTVIGNSHGTTIGTIEHLMSALAGCGIDNAVVSLDNIEVPIMDGSAAPFVAAIEQAGIAVSGAPRRVIRILKPVTVSDGVKSATFTPDETTVFSFDIDFDSAAIAQQSHAVELDGDVFKDEISRARTFGFLHEVEGLRKMGLARGGSLDNAVVISGDTVMNADGLRFSDEFVRHKILDAVGDLYLAGAPFVGRFHGVRSGHALNNQLLRALFADRSAWRYDSAVVSLPAARRALEQLAVA
ncbi:UDP-3-O-[3-hydroxymyristoyl] N-acetylglucosamine deacetylase [Azospirillum agricola]|uniref:UDP-3-O-acyl-N-acetylglucosamine deacetylase n=1 Tax=Azospirillum agricola TaxID=1720247 RepID=UPI001AE55F8A|nr:UDP-3-O-acyl-N-acetylglucosamine deacetylase [Azospirillum agricola]MBP2229084.1 UDP-3-O-[3-hydroxymyristoyl] N-acetylglucosamine deacetylase [Azospirillum agricola]